MTLKGNVSNKRIGEGKFSGQQRADYTQKKKRIT